MMRRGRQERRAVPQLELCQGLDGDVSRGRLDGRPGRDAVGAQERV